MEKNRIELAKYDAKTLCEMSEKVNVTIRTNDALSLCEMVDNFELFLNNLREFSSGLKGKYKLQGLYNYVKNNNVFNVTDEKSVKKFYLDNRIALNVLKNMDTLYDFLFMYFDIKTGEFDKDKLKMFNYIKNNKTNIDKIFMILRRLVELGFELFSLDENNKFDDVWRLDADYFHYSDGSIEAILSSNEMKYKYENSNYSIVCWDFKNIITLNNLLFDKDKLPKDNIYAEKLLHKLAEMEEKTFQPLKTVAQYECYLNELNDIFDKLNSILDNTTDFNYKKHSEYLIAQIKVNCKSLKYYLEEYEKQLLENNVLNSDILDEEKVLCKKKKM